MSSAGIHSVVVVIPAHDEQTLLPACLRALDLARAHVRRARPEVSIAVSVALDRCTDASARIVAQWPGVTAVTGDFGCVGSARRAGVAAALGRVHDAPTRRDSTGIWLANTDADSTVPLDWLTVSVDLAEAGADLVLGTAVPHDDIAPEVAAAWAARHHLIDGHSHVHGANLGIRANTYATAGGWPALASGEDVALASAAIEAGATVSASARIPVISSARLTARAPLGFSSYLRRLADEALLNS